MINLSEAFSQLKDLNEEAFDWNDSELGSDIKSTLDSDIDDSIDVIDPEAQDEDELENSYVGKVILECVVCKSMQYKPVEEVVIDPDSELANVEEECPYCYTTEGYNIVGQVAPYCEEECEDSELEEEDPDDVKEVSEEDDLDDDDDIDESLQKYRRDVSENPVNEELEEIEIKTSDNDKIKIFSEEEAVDEDEKEDQEVLAPVDEETKEEIKDNSVDYDIDDFDEESFDELGESYLKNVYENVESYKTTSASVKDNQLMLEGIIHFASGKDKKTNFIFESSQATKRGKVKFLGENQQITKGKKSFSITGNLNSGKFITESFNYNYSVKQDGMDKPTRFYGTLRTSK